MTVRTISALAAAVGLWLANPAFSKDPVRPAQPGNSNQALAEAVAKQIAGSGAAAGARVQVTTQKGVVELNGNVLSTVQLERILQQAMLVSGVVRVESNLRLITSLETIAPAQAVEPAPTILPAYQQAPGGEALTLPPGSGFGMVQPQMGPQDPIPLAGPQMPAYDQTGPKMPAYAWPTYAPYPNFSRVGYPQAYPYNAFPFIGPFYPFPKVPLGWRSVKLEWDDGHWYLGRLSTPHDYWKIKFW